MVKQYLGLASYYRKFVPRFADILQPLTVLTKKNIPHEWTQMCQDAFDLLKRCLLESPILKYPDPEKPCTLFTDPSKYAWACVLTQAHDHIVEGNKRMILHPITYVSGLFSFYLDDADITSQK